MAASLARLLNTMPLPLFGSARTAAAFTIAKARALPRFAGWALPLATGALWFVWPAVDEQWKIDMGIKADPEAAAKAAAAAEEEAKKSAPVQLSAEATKKVETAYKAHVVEETDDDKLLAEAAKKGDFSFLEDKWEAFNEKAIKPGEDDDDEEEENKNKKQSYESIFDNAGMNTNKKEIVYLLEPSSGTNPSSIIFFLGGAILGQFPHIAYSSFLTRLSAKTNAAIIAIPYEILNLDHFDIAKRAVKKMKRALIQCEDSRGYAGNIRKYAIGHSLGGKLHSVGIAATGMGDELEGIGLVSFNNFGFGETVRLGREFAKELNVDSSGGAAGFGGGPMPFDALIDLAEMAVSAVGLEFTPSPLDTDRIIKAKFDEKVLKKIRLFVFDDDNLDSSERFSACFVGNDAEALPTVSYLPGSHLTPVYLRLGVDDLPNEAKDIASQVSGGFQNASFGNEEELNSLVEEVVGWMMGKGPSRTRSGRGSKKVAGLIDAEIVD
mmetsp:Transcript_12410/g.26058  ORF Transcript_12410/g.26058 Transcript_12410/m.26058 type:complete len:494 (+) Transcript_12410:167-1648(+)